MYVGTVYTRCISNVFNAIYFEVVNTFSTQYTHNGLHVNAVNTIEYSVDPSTKSLNYMKIQLKALNYNKFGNNTLNYSYFELVNS